MLGVMDLASSDGFQAHGTDGDVSALTPKKKEKKQPPPSVQFRPPPDLVDEVDSVRRPLGLSRNEAMTQLLRMGLAEHKRDAAKKRKDH